MKNYSNKVSHHRTVYLPHEVFAFLYKIKKKKHIKYLYIYINKISVHLYIINMCSYTINTFNEQKIWHKCKLWWDKSLNERVLRNVPLGKTLYSPTWDLYFYIYVDWLASIHIVSISHETHYSRMQYP